MSTKFSLETLIILKFLVNSIESGFHKSLFTTKLLERLQRMRSWFSKDQVIKKEEGRSTVTVLELAALSWMSPQLQQRLPRWDEQLLTFSSVLNSKLQFLSPRRGAPTGQIQVQCHHLAVKPREIILSFGFHNRRQFPVLFFFPPLRLKTM